ncbi:Multidrug efflux pump subunit AcrB [Prosthecobacter debontii]|uniref:Multidrug efflux pump subunit AcrB n=1 Tax=Prosthecobacter debontii TaxID=48467 RepID=A0A1T4Z069_9BACT|nr:efflux RND transporter permease subunit [Prosthecobacter debontii]SKB06905.1 Multidrug efflux pump subunit AcrB [Prosthecobacter debontii]
MISWFARNHVAANLLMFAAMLGGVWTLMSDRVPLEVFPDRPSRMISITVPYPASDPEEVEEGIVLKIEESIQQVGSIKHINSTASSSGGTVIVEVEDGKDPREVLDDIKIRVDAIPNMPELAEKPTIQLDDNFHEVITVAIAADMAEADLRRLGEQIRDEISALPGITHVGIAGVRPYEIGIEIPEAKLRKYGLNLERVSEAIRNSALDLPAGVVQTEAGDVSIRTKGRAYTGQDYANVVVLTREDGTKVTLGEIALIQDGFNENPLLARLNGKRCVVVNVMREGGQNAIRIAESVKTYIEESRKRLPDGVQIEFWSDRSKIVKGRINLLLQNAQSSLILVFLCVGLFLRLDAVFWVAVGMVASFLGAIALMPYFDVAINLSSLFGFILVLGIVVDDAIVISEHVDTLRQRGLSPLDAAIQGTKEMAVPITFGVLTTVIAFLPMAMGSSDFLMMFKPIAIVFILVMLIALVETKIILPSHLSHPVPGLSGASDILGPLHRWSERMLRKFVDLFYRPALRWCVHHRYTALAAFFGGLIVLCGFFFSGRILWIFFPRVQSERIEARLTMLDGTPFEVTDAHIMRIYEIAEQMRKDYVGPDGKPVIRAIIATTGTTRLSSSNSSGSTGSSHLGEVNIETYGPEERSLKVNTVDMASDWRARIGNIVGAEELNFRAEIIRSGDPIDIQLSGTDPEELLDISDKIKAHLSTYSGVFDVTDSLDSGRNEIQLRLKPEAQSFGVTVSDLARQVRQAFYGNEVQRIQRGRNEVKVMLRYPKQDRKNLATLETMRVRTASGLEIPFSRVAEAKVGKSFTSIKRVDRRRAINITADVNKATTDPAKVRADAEVFVKDLLASHPHIQWSFEGEARAQREGASEGKWALAIILLGMYAMMAIPFKSYTQPFIVLLVVPFGIVGAVLGHLFHSMPLSSMSVCGMLAVTGVIVNDTLVLVDRINQLREETGDLKYAVQEGGRSRFRAIFLTQITTFVGLMPLMFEFGSLIENSPPVISHILEAIFGDNRAAQATSAQFLTPVSVAMGYGSLFATVITLFLVPLCYLAVDDLGKILNRILGRKPQPEAVLMSGAAVSN